MWLLLERSVRPKNIRSRWIICESCVLKKKKKMEQRPDTGPESPVHPYMVYWSLFRIQWKDGCEEAIVKEGRKDWGMIGTKNLWQLDLCVMNPNLIFLVQLYGFHNHKYGGGFVVVLGSGTVNRIKIDRITNKEKQSQVLIHHLENIRLVMSSFSEI